jgi:succinate dehydrogenase / fumarate reductase cytochrome b subunit
MGLKRNVGLSTALRYKGKGPMLTFILHRIGGLGIVIFVAVHILSSYFGGKAGIFLNTIYENWIFQLVIFFCALFHTINGLRIVLLDLWPKLIEHQREAIWVEWAVFLPIYALAVLVIVRTGLGG